jgi:NTE family protein
MLQGLLEVGECPDFVVGASAGAINALYYAATPTLQGVGTLSDLWKGLGSADVFPLSRLHGMMALMGRRESLLNPAALRRTLGSRIPVQRLEETVIPCHLVATSLHSGEEVILVPVLFPPVAIGDRLLTDGGVSANAPITAAVRLGATRVIVLPTGFPCALRSMPKGLGATVLHTFALMIARQLGADVHRVGATTTVRIVPPLCPMRVAPHDFSQAQQLIEAATLQTRRWLEDGGLERDEYPGALLPHTHDLG